LSQVLEITARDRRHFKKLRDEARNFESLPLRSRLSDDEVARFAAQRWRFPGVDIKARLFRNYPYGELASHVIGYIGRINTAEKEAIDESEDPANYRGTEYIGKLGIEQSYEANCMASPVLMPWKPPRAGVPPDASPARTPLQAIPCVCPSTSSCKS
jgi:penicillin-binding protein 2